MKFYSIGIDPGADGAITVVNEVGHLIDQRLLVPFEEFECLAAMIGRYSALAPKKPQSYIYLEDVHAMPGQGVSSMFAFGRAMGRIEMACIANGLLPRITYVRAQTWTRAMHRAKGATAKIRSVKTAQMIWPKHPFLATARSRVPHPGLVDSALIAEYGRRMVIEDSNRGF